MNRRRAPCPPQFAPRHDFRRRDRRRYEIFGRPCRSCNSPASLRRWIRNASAIKPGVLMPAYQNLSDQDLGALADYLESLK